MSGLLARQEFGIILASLPKEKRESNAPINLINYSFSLPVIQNPSFNLPLFGMEAGKPNETDTEVSFPAIFLFLRRIN